jgi:hypothetical protein
MPGAGLHKQDPLEGAGRQSNRAKDLRPIL